MTLYLSSGAVVNPDDHGRAVGYLSPYVNFYRALSARENLRFVAKLRSGDGHRVDHTLDRVGLTARSSDLVSSYSSGMLQRLRLAAAIMHDPELLLLDEPYANVDAPGADVISEVIDDYLRAARAVVVATNRDDAAGRAGRRITLG